MSENNNSYEIVTNKDRLGGIKYPRTLAEAVSVSEDLNLDTKIDEIDSDLDYIKHAIRPLEIRSFTINDNSEGIIYPMGTQLDSLDFKWELSKDIIDSQYLNDIKLENDIREFTYTTNLNSNHQNTYEFKLEVKNYYDDLPNAEKSISLSFLNYVYFGAAPKLEYAEIHEVFNYLEKKFVEKRKGIYTVNAHNNYIYFAIPSRLLDEVNGEKQCIFSYNGFIGGFNKLGEFSHRNETGFEETYDIFRSTQFNLGLTIFKVE